MKEGNRMRNDDSSGFVAGMVTLYNSDSTIIDNVRTYIGQVGRLYVVDNSDVRDAELIAQLTMISPAIEYLPNDGNLGLGVSLNKAARRAIADSFTHLLMMDDDSSMPADAVGQLYETATANIAENTGIVSATQTDLSGRKATRRPNCTTPTIALTAITAGSLLSLAAYQHVGPFQEELFIDWVDIEYSFRLKRYGYQLLVDHRVRMIHRIGIRKKIALLGFIPYQWRSHSPARLYYKFRNSLFVMKREGDNIPADFRRRFRKELYRNVFRVLLAESNKREFLTLIRRAVADARRGRLGKLE